MKQIQTRKTRYTDDELFHMYVALGEDRTLQRLADITGYKLQTLNNRSASGKWGVRLKDLTEKNVSLINAFVADKKNEVAISEAVVYKGLSDSLLSVIQESMSLIKPTDNPRELKTLLDTYRLIQGQPTNISREEISTIDVSKMTDEELFADTVDDNTLFN